MKRQILSTSKLKSRLNDNAANISKACKSIIQDRLRARYDLDHDEIAIDMYYRCSFSVDCTTTKGGHVNAWPDRSTKQVHLYLKIPKTEMLLHDPEKWAQYVIYELDKQVGGDVVEFWYNRMNDPRYNPYAPDHNTIESTKATRGTNMSKKFTKYPKNYVKASADDVYVWDGKSKVPEDVVHVKIADGVTETRGYAFSNCPRLTRITLPDSLTEIRPYLFNYCSNLTSIAIPDSVTKIGDGAFSHCSSLTSITIPDSVTSIGSYAFYDCSSLTSVTIPGSVTSIGSSAFSGCSSLTSITIPHGVTEIHDYAFLGCSRLTHITLPDSVTKIGNFAFGGCSSLTHITIPSSVTEIDKSAFVGCPKLANTSVGGVPKKQARKKRSNIVDATTQDINQILDFVRGRLQYQEYDGDTFKYDIIGAVERINDDPSYDDYNAELYTDSEDILWASEMFHNAVVSYALDELHELFPNADLDSNEDVLDAALHELADDYG